MEKRKKREILIVILLIFVIVTGFVLKSYLTPKKKYIFTTLCSLDGKRVEAVFEVTWHRHLLTPAELEGMIAVDGIVYRGKISGNRTFAEQIRAKMNGDVIVPHFVIWPQSSVEDAFKNYVWLPYANSSSASENFQLICLYSARDDTLYYGPAENAEEAQAILEKMVNGR